MKTRDEHSAVPAAPASGGPQGNLGWQPRGGWSAARPLASLVPGITRKAFEKHGFAAASLITDWAQIVGARLAGDTRPLKLKWPRPPEQPATGEPGAKGRPGATLVLQVDPAVALDVQYQSAQITERINAYFGYRAVTELRIVQEVISRAPASRANGPALTPHPPHPPAQPTVSPALPAATSENSLEAALARLGAHVLAGKRSG